MAKHRRFHSKIQTTYYPQPGSTSNNSKVSERKLMLIAPRSVYNRFVNYTTESERTTAIAAQEAENRAARERETYEMSKDWDNTVENIRKRREKELLSRRKQEDDIRNQFAGEIAQQNAEARAEILKEARRLLLYRKPECRLINGALLTSECFRERDAQFAFQQTLRGIDVERDQEFGEQLKRDAQEFLEEERRKAVERKEKNRSHGVQLKKQIEEIRNDGKQAEEERLAQEKAELQHITEELKRNKELEAKQMLVRKKEARRILTEAIEQKRAYELETKLENEFAERANQIYEKSKQRINEIEKIKAREIVEQKRRHAELMAQKCAVVVVSKSADEEARIAEVQNKREAEELARIEDRKKLEAARRAEYVKGYRQAEEEKLRRQRELKEINNWETIQRLKRDEFNKEYESNERKREWEKKLTTAAEYDEQIAEAEKERAREKMLAVQSYDEMIEKTNKKILDYGEEVLEESRGVRPLFPIIKAIEKFKIESGLARPKKCEEVNPPIVRKRGKRRMATNLTSVPEDKIVYL